MTDKIKWPYGSQMHALKKAVKDNLDTILTGKLIGIDPASKTLGYAVSEAGVINDNGTIELDPKQPLNQRLQDLVKTLQKDGEYSILVIEMIRGKMSHAYLKFSVGAVMGGVQAKVAIEVPVNVWRAVAGKDHVKSDANDAHAILNAVLTLAKELDAERKQK